MPDFTDLIRQAVARNNYKLTHHTIKRMAERQVLEEEIIAAVLQGDVIERRPNDQPFPKCLFMYPVRPGNPLYVSCAYNERRGEAHIVTIHWFDPERWIDWRTRRRYPYA
jgi:hypothetical protein